MVFWCLAPFPGSVWSGIPLHDSFIHLVWEALHIDRIIGPESLMLKYNTLGSAPAMLHALPGAVWCALAPMQLAGPRKGAARKAHTIGGRVMLASAAVLMLGYAIIDGNGLTAEEYDFGGNGGRLAEMIDSSAIGSLAPLSFHKTGLKVSHWPCRCCWVPANSQFTTRSSNSETRIDSIQNNRMLSPRLQVVAAWFAWSGMKTMTSARSGDFQAHRAWAIRHLGAGLWVAAQRPLFSMYRLMQFVILGEGECSRPLGH